MKCDVMIKSAHIKTTSPQSDTFLMSDLTRTLRPQTQVNATVNKPIRHQSETELLQITLNRFSNITAANMGILVMPPRKSTPITLLPLCTW